MDFSKMTDEQVFDALRSAERDEYEAKAVFMACAVELESRVNAEWLQRQAEERSTLARDARNAAIDYDIEHHAGCCCVVCIEE